MARRVVDVLVPVALDQAYSYRVPEALDACAGRHRVACRSARARRPAVVWAENPKPNPRLDNRLKDVEEKLDLPPLKRRSCASFVDWVAELHAQRRAAWCCACACAWASISARARARRRAPRRAAAAAHDRGARARARACSPTAWCAARARRRAKPGVSAGVIDGLIDEGTLETLVLPPEPVARQPDPDFARPDFTGAQRAAADALRATRRQGRLFGDAARRRHRLGQDRGLFRGGGRRASGAAGRALILMPEIALTAQFLDRFAARFGVRPAEWHSELSPRRRARTWTAVADGRGRGRRRRALGAVPAVRRSRPDRRR